MLKKKKEIRLPDSKDITNKIEKKALKKEMAPCSFTYMNFFKPVILVESQKGKSLPLKPAPPETPSTFEWAPSKTVPTEKLPTLEPDPDPFRNTYY